MPNLGKCCECEREEPEVHVSGVLMLPFRSPEPGGWACFVCGLEALGAVAVLCDDCISRAEKEGAFTPKYAVLGFPSENRRIPADQLTERFEHDQSKHAAEEQQFAADLQEIEEAIDEIFDEVIEEYAEARKKTDQGDGGL